MNTCLIQLNRKCTNKYNEIRPITFQVKKKNLDATGSPAPGLIFLDNIDEHITPCVVVGLPFENSIQDWIDKCSAVFNKSFPFTNAVRLLLIVLFVLLLPGFYIKTKLFFQQLPRFIYVNRRKLVFNVTWHLAVEQPASRIPFHGSSPYKFQL
jgi:hypothetical protein